MTSSPVVDALPDVAHQRVPQARALDWVGMDGIALPLHIDGRDVAARVDIAVNLQDPAARGIHMSRLYLQLQRDLAGQPPTPALLRTVLADAIDSQGGLSTRARLRIAVDLLLDRPALKTDHHGWKAYPLLIEAEAGPDGVTQWLQVEVVYSSTCPASAALARQRNAERVRERFGATLPDIDTLLDWMQSEDGMAATPHAQRSEARVRVQLDDAAQVFDARGMVDAIEAALGTPVQTAVKRADEQAFAEANAANLMFCEDAARRIAAALDDVPQISRWDVRVAHLESLHAHDAVAAVSGGR